LMIKRLIVIIFQHLFVDVVNDIDFLDNREIVGFSQK